MSRAPKVTELTHIVPGMPVSHDQPWFLFPQCLSFLTLPAISIMHAWPDPTMNSPFYTCYCLQHPNEPFWGLYIAQGCARLLIEKVSGPLSKFCALPPYEQRRKSAIVIRESRVEGFSLATLLNILSLLEYAFSIDRY